VEDRHVSEKDDTPSREREEIMTKLATRIDSIDDRVATLMHAEETDERILIRWIRTQGYLAGQYRKLMKDTDIDEIQDDLELLKDVTEVED
jgi:hypothetical protein